MKKLLLILFLIPFGIMAQSNYSIGGTLRSSKKIYLEGEYNYHFLHHNKVGAGILTNFSNNILYGKYEAYFTKRISAGVGLGLQEEHLTPMITGAYNWKNKFIGFTTTNKYTFIRFGIKLKSK